MHSQCLPKTVGPRSGRQETRHFQTGEFRRAKMHMMGDVGKELPEDAELENLVDMDIPGLVAPGERFETREMPRLAPHRHWDLDFTEMEGARPQAGRPYPVAPQHLPRVKQTD